ncbi:MAG: hypothetical protein RLZ77_1308 [Bacteroidota bacterium]|jgi:hypothetical protein
METNFLALLTAAASTLIVGFIWYNPRVFGNLWMKEAGLNYADLKGSNLIKTLGISFIYAFFVAFIIQMLTVHQFGALGMIGGDPTIAKASYTEFMTDYGNAFRTFKHGALHGFMSGLFMALPIIGTSALHEQRSFKYTLISGGFWVVSCTIMGGIVCGWPLN